MTEKKTSKGLHIGIWVAQGLLAAAFGMAGGMKITSPIEQLAQNGMSFVAHYQTGTVRFIGMVEVLAAIGLILPSALRILPKLTPLAATGLSVVMFLASQYLMSHSESPLPTIVLFALCVFVAWGRFKLIPILPKT